MKVQSAVGPDGISFVRFPPPFRGFGRLRELGQAELMYRLSAIVFAVMAAVIRAQSPGIAARFNEAAN